MSILYKWFNNILSKRIYNSSFINCTSDYGYLFKLNINKFNQQTIIKNSNFTSKKYIYMYNLLKLIIYIYQLKYFLFSIIIIYLKKK